MNLFGVVCGVMALAGCAAAGAAAREAMRVKRAAVLAASLGGARAGRVTRPTWRTPPRWFRTIAGELSPQGDSAGLWRWYVSAAAGSLVGGFLVAGPILGAIAVATTLGAPHLVAGFLRGRRSAAYDTALASALDAVARAVRGGGSLQSALKDGAGAVRGQTADDLWRVVTLVERGTRLDSALGEWRARRDRTSVKLAVGAITLAAQTGGPPARVIEDVATSLRVRMQVEGEARALGAQARLSAVVVGVAPVGFALVSSAVDPRNAQLMFGTPIGIACLVLGLALDVVGAVWMHRVSETVLG